MSEGQESGMWTKGIRLESVSKSEFEALRESWGTRSNGKRDSYARMYNPVVAKTYQELIDMFLRHPRADQLTVREDGWGWHGFHMKDISPALKEFVAILAANNDRKYNNFEMRFLATNSYARGIEQRAKIKFAERDGLVVGYETSVYKGNIDLFDSRLSVPTELIVSGICAPEDCRL